MGGRIGRMGSAMSGQRGILVIDDGDLGGLVGCAASAEEGGRSFVWADVGHPGGIEREQAVRRHAETYGLEVVGGREALSAPVDESGGASTRLLIEAGLAAVKAGVERVFWCVHLGGEAELGPIARACDRALLATRLLSLDVAVRIEAPYADLSDVQMAELAADLDAPVESCWWAMGTSEEAVEARRRWTRAMTSAGLGDVLIRAGG